MVLIDFDYPHWHKLTDTLDKCSPESMFSVIRVMAEILGKQHQGGGIVRKIQKAIAADERFANYLSA